MRTQFERDYVKVAVLADADGKVERVEVDVDNGVHEVVVKRVMRHGRPQWEIKGGAFVGGGSNRIFEDVWAAIPDYFVKGGRRYDVANVVAEVIDATGAISPATNGLSSATADIKAAVADFKSRFLGDITMRLLRHLLEAEGYSVKPDLQIMRTLGARARECAAYHEMMGSMYDRFFLDGGNPPNVHELKEMSEDWASLNEFLED